MKEVTQLKLQAWLDGELSGSEERSIAELHAQDPELQALAEGLSATRNLLRGNEVPRSLPVSGDFFWSRVQLQILRGQTTATAAPARAAWMRWISRLLVPVGAAALLGVLLVPLLKTPASREVAAFSVESSMPGSSVVAFHSEAEGVTVVWVDSR